MILEEPKYQGKQIEYISYIDNVVVYHEEFIRDKHLAEDRQTESLFRVESKFDKKEEWGQENDLSYIRCVENLEQVYLGGPLTENIYNTINYRLRREDLYMFLEEGRLRYNTFKETARVVVIEIDR